MKHTIKVGRAAVLRPAVLFVMGCLAWGCAAGWPADEPAKPAHIRDYIVAQQREHIGVSTGVWAHQCFTRDDLETFLRTGKHRATAARLAKSKQFVAIVDALKAMPEAERKTLLEKARHIAHPIWAQLGEIRADGSGQTEAGQRAELLLAGAIVDEMERALNRTAGTRQDKVS